MKYSGRLVGVLFFFTGTSLWGLHYYVYTSNISIYLILFILSSAALGWYMGKKYDQAKYYSEKDYLTGTYNRRFIYEIFPKLTAQLQRNNQKLCLSVVDVDNFKSLNDRYGHELGDQVLSIIADILTSNTRAEDTVARWGGDEFLIIAPCIDINYTDVIFSRLHDKLGEQSETLDVDFNISIGTAIYPDDASDLDTLIKLADSNMYKIKFRKRSYSGRFELNEI